MKPDQWLDLNLGQEQFTPGLERINKFLISTNKWIEDKKVKVVTIAGTNGKGETAHTLAYHLQNADISYGLWTSPHILKVNERIKVNGVEISDEEFLALADSIQEEMKLLRIGLSYYEFLFVLFLRYCQVQNVQVLVLEVGLGGRLDAVNALSASFVGLTSISRDHQEYLGSRYDQILEEKLGVLRRNALLISALKLNYLRMRVQQKANALSITWIDYFEREKFISTDFSMRNQWVATELFKSICGKDPQKFTRPPLKGRGEVMTREDRRFIFIGSHNVDGLRELSHTLQSVSGPLRFQGMEVDVMLVSFSKRDNRDTLSMMKVIKNLTKHCEVCFTNFDHYKADSEILAKAKKLGFKVVGHLDEVVRSPYYKSKTILVTGSYYFVGLVQQALLE